LAAGEAREDGITDLAGGTGYGNTEGFFHDCLFCGKARSGLD
jgi:hypothetical protein